MTKYIPVIAVRRRKDAIGKFQFKLDKLQDLLTKMDFDRLPKKIEPATFMAWEDEELGVSKLSRNLLYIEDEDEYKKLNAKLKKLLSDLAKARNVGKKKEEKVSALVMRIEAADRRAETYLNDYSTLKALYDDSIKTNARLEERLARLTANIKKVKPFDVTKKRPGTEDK